MQVREVSGFGNAEAGGSVFCRVLNLTVASVVSGSGAEQTFTAGLSIQVLGGDVLLTAHAASAGQTAGVVSVPGRTTSIGSIGIDFIYGGGTATLTAAAPLTAAFYNLCWLRR